MLAARTIEILRTERGLGQRQLAARCTALGRPMSNTMLSRIELAKRRCDIDDLVAIAEACRYHPSPSSSARAPPEPPTHPSRLATRSRPLAPTIDE